jgi:methionyl-tRNA formyltransferase
MRLVFMGTPDFAVPALDALVAAGHEVACVYTRPPRPGGRGKRPRPSPVQARAEAMGLPVRTPASLRDAAEQAAFAALAPRVAVVVAYGLILPPAVLAAPARGCLNIHASLLPRWRGAAPIQRAVMAGDEETGVSIMAMEAGLDTGPVLLAEAVSIGPHTWTRPGAQVDRLIRGLAPFPGAWTEVGGERVKLLLSELAPGSAAPGTVLDDRLAVACGQGAVRLLKLQRAGAGVVDADAFLRGRPLERGSRIG